jgi:sulfoxide reductase heme-binding subunit YedZ
MKVRWAVTSSWIAGVLIACLLARGDVGAYSRALALTRAFGLISLCFLSLALCVSPLARLARALHRPFGGHVSNLRRASGLAAASGALLHAACAVTQSPLRWSEQFEEASLRWGIGALLVLCALALTSFGAVLRRLRLSTWKELHRLAYAAFGCAVLHALLMPFAWTLGILGGCCCVLAVGVLRLLPGPERSNP